MTQNKAKEFRVRVVAQGGAAYATNLDTGEEVFINAALASADESAKDTELHHFLAMVVGCFCGGLLFVLLDLHSLLLVDMLVDFL